MTIQIGSQADVPSPGSPIVSPWYQDTATKIVHRFASQADRDAKWPLAQVPRGAMCITTDTDTVWRKRASAWVALAANIVGGLFNLNTDSAGNFSIVGANSLGGVVQFISVSFDTALMSFYSTRSPAIFPYLSYRMSPNNQNIECAVYLLTMGSPSTITRPGMASYTGFWQLMNAA